MGIHNDTIKGRLFSKVRGSGTRSEGPQYWITPVGKYAQWGEILVRKKVHMWQKDPVLHNYINENVAIFGEIIETKDSITIDYIEVVKEKDQ